MSDPQPARLLVWDLPIRLFHWALVALIAMLWWTGTQRTLDWHRLAGYGVAALLIFRLVWGVVGSATARFSGFVRAPGVVAAYARGSLFARGATAHVGHNPLGGWSVVAMLALLLAQVALGMVSVDVDGIESGPFAYLVSFETGRRAAELHHLLFNGLLALIALHVAAVLFYLVVKRHNLVGAMLTGRLRSGGAAPRIAQTGLAAAVLAGAVAVVWIAVSVWGRA